MMMMGRRMKSGCLNFDPRTDRWLDFSFVSVMTVEKLGVEE